MGLAQQFVVSWLEFAVAGTLLLAATKMAVDRLRQPVDRINLIVISLVLAAIVPMLLGWMGTASLRLGLLTNQGQQFAIQSSSNETNASRNLHEGSSASGTPAVNPLPLDWLGSDQTEAANELPAKTDENGSARSSANDAADNSIASNTWSEPAAIPSAAAAQNQAAQNQVSQNQTAAWPILAAVLLLGHGLAASWFFFQWILGAFRLRGIASRARQPESSVLKIWQEVSDGLGGHVRLLTTREVDIPSVFNRRHPVILIPESIASGDSTTLRFCLSHEWSHVIGGDLQRWHVVNLCQILFWYQPLYWMLRRELRLCQDLIADDRAAESSGNQLGRIEYSELLMHFANLAPAPGSQSAIAFFDRTSQLARRIRAVLASEQSIRSQSTRAFYWTSTVIVLAVSMLVGSIRLSTSHADTVAVENSSATQADATQDSADSQAEDSDQVKVVRGRVVDAGGEPVAGAMLWLPLQHYPKRTVEGKSDDAGNFELIVPTNWISPRMVGSTWTVWAYAPGHSIQSQSVYEVLRESGEKQYAIKLPAPTNLQYQIRSPDGQLLADVLVQPMEYKTSTAYEWVPEEMRKFVSARSDINGWVALAGVESDLLLNLELNSMDFGRQTIRVDSMRSSIERQIRLRPVSSIEGRLVADKAEWARDVKVIFTTDNQDQWTETRGIAEVVTDTAGHFHVQVIASGGPLRTYVQLAPELPVRPILPDNVFLNVGETEELEIPLVSAPLVHGKVVAKSTRKPVANAEIHLAYDGYRQSDTVTTDEHGRYQGRALPGGLNTQVIVLPFEFLHFRDTHDQPIQVPDEVEEFELPTIEVHDARIFAGRLIGTDDRPLPDASVIAVKGGRRYGFGKSDADGHFRVQVPDGIETDFHVTIEGLGSGSSPATIVQTEPLIVRHTGDLERKNSETWRKKVETERARKADVALTGRVLMGGKPVSDAKVVLSCGIPVSRDQPNSVRYERVGTTWTNGDGNYRVSGLKAGDSYHIKFIPPAPFVDPYGHETGYRKKLSNDDQGDIELPDKNLLTWSQSIAGVVVDSEGNPVTGAIISVRILGGEYFFPALTRVWRPFSARSDHQGLFELRSLPDAPMVLTATFENTKGNQMSSPTFADLNQQDIRVVLDLSLDEEKKP